MNFPEPPVPPHLTDTQIQSIVDDFRTSYWPEGALPVDSELIAEHLGISFVPIANLRDETGIDATLSADRELLYIDLEYFRNPRQENRVRFSVAHELGHYMLHQALFDYYHQNMPGDVFEWACMMRWLHDQYEAFYEQQAHEFAGRLLVPCDQLSEAIRPYLEQIRAAGIDVCSDASRAHLASKVQRIFMVASQVIEIRLRKCRIQ